jgi:membrane fusion protein (multidrug efflux system)
MPIGGIRRRGSFAVAALLLASVLLTAACAENKQTQETAPPPAPTVTVAAVVRKDVTPSDTYNGRIEAVDSVDLRARVEGFVEERHFEEGAEVKAHDLLIVLEKAPYEAQIGEIRGQIKSAEGTLRLAKLEVDREKELVKRQVAAQAALDEAEAKHTQALGELERLRAALKRSELNLSYTDIKAPIDGRIGRLALSVGDFVTPSSESLTAIVSQEPMYVSFPVTARRLLEIRKMAEATGRDPRAVAVKLRLPDGSIYSETGTISFVDVRVDRTTDTVTVRGTVANPKRLLIHDQLVGVIVEEAQPVQALVIPQAALAIDQAGPYVLVVDENSTAEQRRIRLGGTYGSEIAVAEGLKEGEHIIVEGLQKVRPGQVVRSALRPQ